MMFSPILLTIITVLLCQAHAGFFNGGCADDCIESLNITTCEGDDSNYGWDCLCNDEPALDSVNNCISSSCTSEDQDAIFGNIAQACANRGTPITAAPAEATFSATSGGTLFASWYSGNTSDGRPWNGKGHGIGREGHCSWTTFTGNWGDWVVSWSGFNDDDDDNCSTTTDAAVTMVTSPSSVSATTTGSASLSLGAAVTTTISGQTLTGTIFSAVESTTGTTETAAAQSGGSARTDMISAFGAIAVALLATICMQ